MIEFRDVTKTYGNVRALDDLSITIDKPGIYCLLGRNGAGKTTMLKTMAGHIAPSEGSVRVNGNLVNTLSMPDDVHFVEVNAAQFNVRLSELFTYAADINPTFDRDFAVTLAQGFDLDMHKRYRQLSFGMKAMVNTLIALASGKEILLLDEPVLGFDPLMRKRFYDMLYQSCSEKSQTVIVSTHIIDEIAKVAERIIIIDKGKLVLFTEMSDIDEEAYRVTGTVDAVKDATQGLWVLSESEMGGYLSRYIYDKRIDPGEGYSLTPVGLQDFFIALVGNEKEVF